MRVFLLHKIFKKLLSVVTLFLFSFGSSVSVFAQTYTQSTTTYSWDSPSTNVSTSSCDDCRITTVTLPFGFTFFGTVYGSGTAITLSTNGWLSFSTQSSSYWTNTCLPNAANPNNLIAAYWDDIYFDYGCAPTVWRYGTYGTTPNRRFVVSWLGFRRAGGACGNYIYTQIKLFETSNNIEVHVQSNSLPVTNSGTIGIENSGGTTGYQAVCNTNPGNGVAWRWTPDVDPCSEAINIPSAPVTNQSLVCTGVATPGNLNATNVPAACGGASNNYKGGQEALYTFTPTLTGTYNISYSGQTYSSIFVYSGACPASGGTCIGSVGNSGSSQSLDVALTASTLYYIWFDTWPTPNSPCAGTFSLTLPNTDPDVAYVSLNTDASHLYGGLQYQLVTDHTDPDGQADVDYAYAGIGFDGTWEISFYYDYDASSYGINSGGAYVTLNSVTKSSIANGWRMTWTFTMDWDWAVADGSNNVDPIAQTTDNAGAFEVLFWNYNYDYENDLRITSISYTSSQPTNTSFNVNGYLNYEGVTTPNPPEDCADIRIDPAWTVTNYDDLDLTSAGYWSINVTSSSDCEVSAFDIDIINPPSGAGTVSSNGNSVTTDDNDCTGLTAMTLGTSYTGTLGTTCSDWTTYTSCGWSEPGDEIVYTFTPKISGFHLFTCNTTSGDPDFFLMSSCGTAGTNYFGSCFGGGTRYVNLTKGTTYYLIADNWNSGSNAGYDMTVTWEPCYSSNITSMSLNTYYTSPTLGTDGKWDGPYTSCGWSEPGAEKVFSYACTSTGLYLVECDVTSGDPDFFLMNSCGTGGTNIFGSCVGSGDQFVTLTTGNTYYLIVDNWSSGSDATFGVRITYGCTTPATQATNVSYSSVTSISTNVSWTRGNGSTCAVFMKQTSTGTSAPVTTYTANTAFGSGTQIGATGWYCIYNGTGTSVSVTNLSCNTAYRVHVTEYNCTGVNIKYNTAAGASNNPNNQTTVACPGNTTLNNPFDNYRKTYNIDFDWTASPVNLYNFVVDDNYSFVSSVINVNQAGNTYTISSGLTNGYTYYWKVRASNDGGTSWSSWSSIRSFTYNSAIATADWYQNCYDQFNQGTPGGTNNPVVDNAGDPDPPTDNSLIRLPN